jgi:hypothetical protein
VQAQSCLDALPEQRRDRVSAEGGLEGIAGPAADRLAQHPHVELPGQCVGLLGIKAGVAEQDLPGDFVRVEVLSADRAIEGTTDRTLAGPVRAGQDKQDRRLRHL